MKSKYKYVCFYLGDTTGKESIYTVVEGHEIMFHISTMLPFSKDNKQQVSIYVQTYKVYLMLYKYFLWNIILDQFVYFIKRGY